MTNSLKSTATSASDAQVTPIVPHTPQLEHLAFMVSTVKLNGHNFMEWSQSAKITLMSRGKMKYVNGTATAPEKTDPKYETWEIENYTVMSWLIRSMQPEIIKTYLLLPTAREIWLAVHKTFSKIGFTSQIFQIKRQIEKTKQGNISVTDYYNNLKGLLTELDLYQNVEMESATDTARLKDLLEKERVFKFLLGLNPEFEQVCDRTLGRETFPDLDQAFALVRGDESRKELLHGKENKDSKNLVEGSALAVSKPNFKYGDNKIQAEKDKRWCDFCNRPRHRERHAGEFMEYQQISRDPVELVKACKWPLKIYLQPFKMNLK
ncbi:hypothetical protein EZV62_012251 [Acer yangbiense]|uniref:Uncharacterized protein n=1 Tax=Acer yangbiense TaxID=1000413 RepID=A0A5C7HVS2_9ROSI|nr:hypothetical protein EZV62_012251 [Acer yangbiense]